MKDLTNTTRASKVIYGCLGPLPSKSTRGKWWTLPSSACPSWIIRMTTHDRCLKGVSTVRDSVSEGCRLIVRSPPQSTGWILTIFSKMVECIWTTSSRSATSTIHGRFVDCMIWSAKPVLMTYVQNLLGQCCSCR